MYTAIYIALILIIIFALLQYSSYILNKQTTNIQPNNPQLTNNNVPSPTNNLPSGKTNSPNPVTHTRNLRKRERREKTYTIGQLWENRMSRRTETTSKIPENITAPASKIPNNQEQEQENYHEDDQQNPEDIDEDQEE